MHDKQIQTAIACLRQTPGAEIRNILGRLGVEYQSNNRTRWEVVERYIRALEKAGVTFVRRQYSNTDKAIYAYPPGYRKRPLFEGAKVDTQTVKVYRPDDPDYPGIPKPDTSGFRLSESYNPVEYTFLNSTQKRKKAS